MIEIVIPGNPIPFKSAQFFRNGFLTGCFNPRRKEIDDTKLVIRSQYRGNPIEDAVVVSYKFYMPIPRSWSKKKKELASHGQIPHTSYPDKDNMIKFYQDCLKGIVLDGDRIVCGGGPEGKQYDSNPRTVITIEKWIWEKHCL